MSLFLLKQIIFFYFSVTWHNHLRTVMCHTCEINFYALRIQSTIVWRKKKCDMTFNINIRHMQENFLCSRLFTKWNLENKNKNIFKTGFKVLNFIFWTQMARLVNFGWYSVNFQILMIQVIRNSFFGTTLSIFNQVLVVAS